MSKPNLSVHDLKQMDEAWHAAQPEPVVRVLLTQTLEDRRAVCEARESQGLPPSVTHATQIEQLRQLCDQHRDARPKALCELAREFPPRLARDRAPAG